MHSPECPDILTHLRRLLVEQGEKAPFDLNRFVDRVSETYADELLVNDPEFELAYLRLTDEARFEMDLARRITAA